MWTAYESPAKLSLQEYIISKLLTLDKHSPIGLQYEGMPNDPPFWSDSFQQPMSWRTPSKNPSWFVSTTKTFKNI